MSHLFNSSNRKLWLVGLVAVSAVLLGSATYIQAVSSNQVAIYSQWTTVKSCTIQVFTDGTTFYAQNCDTGALVTSGTNARTVIDTALTNGGITLLKAGFYPYSTGTLTIGTANTTLVGEGVKTVLQPASGVHGITVSASDVRIANIYIDHVNSGTGDGIRLTSGVDRVVVENVKVEDGYHSVTVLGNNSDDIVIRNNLFINGGRADGSIFVSEGSGSGKIRRLDITNNHIVTPTVHGIQVQSTTAGLRLVEEVKIQDNFVDDPSQAGIFISRTNGTNIEGNTVLSATKESIDVEGSVFVTVANNRLLGGTLQGINVIPVSTDRNAEIVIVGNNVHTTGAVTGDGVVVNDADRVVVANNNVEMAGDDGIVFVNTISDVVVQGNDVVKLGSLSNTGIRFNLGGGKTGDNVIVIGNRVHNFNFGLQYGSGTLRSMITIGNDVRNNTSPIVLTVTPTNLILNNNQGFVTENEGTGTINSGSTSATITHGLAYTPSAAECTWTFTENPTTDPGNTWISSISSTQFTVNVRTDPGASNLDFSWACKRIG